MKKRTEPMRLCVGCRQMQPKNQMMRVVLRDGEARLDPTGKADGRGVYVCRNAKCVTGMQKARRARLAGSGMIPDSVFDELREVAERG